MGFWLFMVVMDLLIPVMMIGFGSVFEKYAPAEINNVFGYRTAMSKKNRDTWEFAHRYLGRLWRIWGWILVPISLIILLLVLGKDENVVGNVGAVLCFGQMAPMILTVICTEWALRKKFDKNGQVRGK